MFEGGAFEANLPARQRSLAGRKSRFGALTKAFFRLIGQESGKESALGKPDSY